MANFTLGGLRWAKSRDGGKQPVERGVVASAYATGIFRGDPVKRVNDGTLAVAAAGDAVLGVCTGVMQYKASDGTIRGGNFLPASTTYSGTGHLGNPQASIIFYTPVQRQVFEADVNAAVASLAAAQTLVGNNFDVAAGAGGSTTSGRSTYVIDHATAATTTAQFRLMEIVQDALNDVTAVNWKGLFEVVESTEPAPGTATGT